MSGLLLVAAVALTASPVSGFNCNGDAPITRAAVADAHTAYSQQSVAIVKAALAGDTAGLNSIVAADAEFTLFYGDAGVGPRSSGLEAAVEFFRHLAPEEFEYRLADPGPIALDPCAHIETEVSLRKAGSDEIASLTFKFDRGILSGVVGNGATVVSGTLDFGGAR